MMLEERGPCGVGHALVKARRVRHGPAMDAKTEREKRLAAALRDNLKRRKAAASAQPAERDRDSQEDGDQR